MVELLKSTYRSWSDDRTMRLGAGLAYYGLFAVVPLAILAAAFAGFFFTQADIEGFLQDFLNSIFGTSADAAATQLSAAIEEADVGAGLGVLGAASLVVAASLFFRAFQDALAVIWHVPVQHGLRTSVTRYLLAFLVVLLTGALLLASLTVQAAVGLAEALIPGNIRFVDSLATTITAVATWALGVGLLAVLFRWLPRAEVAWRYALIGAAITSLLLVVGTHLLGLYLNRFGATSLTGVAGAVLLGLVWIYYEAQILLVGAQLTKALNLRAT